jgi:hypothetical protein
MGLFQLVHASDERANRPTTANASRSADSGISDRRGTGQRFAVLTVDGWRIAEFIVLWLPRSVVA